MRSKIEDELVAMGIYPNLLGFDYICIIVEKIISLEAIKIMQLYDIVADINNTTPRAVERAIRTAISKCNCDCYKKLRNSEFLHTLALNINREARER